MLHASLEALLCIITPENKKVSLKYAPNLFNSGKISSFYSLLRNIRATLAKIRDEPRNVFAIEIIFVNS